MKKIETKKKLLKDFILGDIAKGLYKSGDKLPSEREYAEKHFISRSTTRKALQELESDGILTCRETVGYFVSPDASRILNGHDEKEYALKVGAVFQPKLFANPFSIDFFNELTSYTSPEIKLTTYFHSFLKSEVYLQDRLNVIIAGEPYDKSDLWELQDHNIEVILFNQILEEFNYISTDNYKSGHLMLENLAKNGHKNVFCIKIPNLPENNEFNLRIKGIQDAAEKYGVNMNYKKLAYYQVVDNINQYAADITAPDRSITAICAIAGTLAINLYQLLEDNGLRIPEDMSLIGVDDCSFNSHLNIPMTIIRNPYEKIAAKLAKWLQNLMDGKKEKIQENVEPALIERSSVGKLRSEKAIKYNRHCSVPEERMKVGRHKMPV